MTSRSVPDARDLREPGHVGTVPDAAGLPNPGSTGYPPPPTDDHPDDAPDTFVEPLRYLAGESRSDAAPLGSPSEAVEVTEQVGPTTSSTSLPDDVALQIDEFLGDSHVGRHRARPVLS